MHKQHHTVTSDVEHGTLPRPEYPRPQFIRDEWLNLNGTWEFAFDDEDTGLQQNWHDGRALNSSIIVPFAYQTQLSGINDQSIHEVIWYARSFRVPASWQGQHVLLHFGAVDYRTTVWVNGHEVGHNQGGHVPFSFDILPYLHDGENRVTLRVEDTQDPQQPRGKQSSSGKPGGIDYFCTSGIWQTVWLEPVSPIRIDSLRITPVVAASVDESSAFEVRVYLHAPATGWRIEVDILDGANLVASAATATWGASCRLHLDIPDAKLWSPDAPHLYDVQVRLFDGEQLLDSVQSYAGLRSVQIQDGAVLLNGQPVYLLMTLDQGYWPDGGMTAPGDEALRADVEWAKRLGYNCARKHQKVEDPRWLYWCDKLGLLVWGEMANARVWSPKAEEWLMAEWERVVRRDINHPCIIVWVPVNESMGFPHLYEEHPGQHAFLERIVTLTRRLDSDRLVIDNDGWEHTDLSDICAIHDYTPTAARLRERYATTLEDGSLPANVWYKNKPLFIRGSRYRGQPIMLTEVGGFMIRPENLSPDAREHRYQLPGMPYATPQSMQELLDSYRDLMQGLSTLPFVVGFCYTQLTDIEQEMNGLLSYNRQPKVDPESIAAIHREHFGAEAIARLEQWRQRCHNPDTKISSRMPHEDAALDDVLSHSRPSDSDHPQ